MLLDLVISLCRFDAVATILLAYVLYLFLSWWRNPLRKIPGPRGSFILGNTLDLGSPNDPQKVIHGWNKTYGDIFKTWHIIGGYQIHIVNPEHVKNVLVTNSTQFERPDFLKKLIGFKSSGNTLFRSNGKEHALRRKLLNPSFSYYSVQSYIPVFNKAAKDLIENWSIKIKKNGGEVEEEILSKFTCLTLDVIGETAFGYNFNSIDGCHSKESKATDTILRGQFDLRKRFLEILFPVLQIFPSKERAKVEEAKRILDEIVLKVIKERKCKQSAESSKEERKDFLQILLDLNESGSQQYTDADLLNEVRGFMIAGHETTSMTMTWTILLLAKHQEYQERARREIRQVLGGKDEVTFQDLAEMKFLESCVKESMRLHPAAIFVRRRAISDINLGSYTIPKGTNLLIDITSAQRNEQIWKAAHTFDPNHFYNVGDQSKLQYHFLPFSRGPRMCIGYRFAEVEIKLVLAKLLNAFHFKLGKNQSDEFKGEVLLTMRPTPSPVAAISFAE